MPETGEKMSKTILEIIDTDGKEFIVTAFVGANGNASIQLTTKNDYISLNEKQVKELIKVLRNRINRKEGFQATD